MRLPGVSCCNESEAATALSIHSSRSTLPPGWRQLLLLLCHHLHHSPSSPVIRNGMSRSKGTSGKSGLKIHELLSYPIFPQRFFFQQCLPQHFPFVLIVHDKEGRYHHDAIEPDDTSVPLVITGTCHLHDYNPLFRLFTLILFHDYSRPHRRKTGPCKS